MTPIKSLNIFFLSHLIYNKFCILYILQFFIIMFIFVSQNASQQQKLAAEKL